MRRLSIGVLLILVLLFSTACMRVSLAPENEAPSRVNNENDRQVELTFWHTYSDIETEVFQTRVLPLFEQQFPHIRIKASRKDHTGQLKDNVFGAVADHKQPDVMRMDIIWVPEFAKNGALTDLTDMKGFQQLRERFIGSLIQTNYYKGRYYGVPVNANTRAAIFNKELLERAGLKKPPTTFKEVVAATKRLQQAGEDIYGIGMCCSNGWGSLPYFWTFGGQIMNEDYTQATGYLNSEDSMIALEQMRNWLNERIISPSILGEEPGTWDGILKGQLLMIDDAHWFYTVNETGANKELLDGVVIGLFPSDVTMGTSVIGGENLVVFDGSKYKEEAWTFIQWMVTDEPQRIMSETGLIPTIKNLRNAHENSLYNLYLEQLNRADPRPPVPAWTEIEDIFARMLERILAGEQTIKDGTNQAAHKIDQLLKSNE
jgi:multiple sugar transport system substrate-binding protein